MPFELNANTYPGSLSRGALGIISKESLVNTDENGRARILAPNNRNEIILLAQKKGYTNATEKVWINVNPDIIDKILKNPYTIIIFSLIILFFPPLSPIFLS